MILKLITAAVTIGIISGFLIAGYELLIIFTTYVLFAGDPIKTIPTLPVWYLYALPIVAIFIVNYILSKDSNIREYTINEIAESISQNKMTISIKTLFLKIISSVISLSSGFVVGTEGPSAGIGAMVAYQVQKFFKMPKMLIKMFISVGASAGIAAIFVSPITGIAFAVEYIAYQFLKQYIGYLIIASVIAFSISANLLESLYFSHSVGRSLNIHYILSNAIFIPYITFFVYFYLILKKRMLHFIDLEIFKNASKYRNYIFSLIGGGTIGTILLIEPHAAFSGREVVTYLINNSKHISLYFIYLVLVLRIIGTTVSIYANAVGGLFLPVMSIGALAGYGYGEILSQFHLSAQPFYFAAIGAAVFMGVIMKLPLTAVVLSLETTFDYNVVIATGVIVVFVSYLSSLKFDIRHRYMGRADKIKNSFKKLNTTKT